MSIEQLLERIAQSSERTERLIEQLLNVTDPDQQPAAAPAVVPTPAPTPAPAPFVVPTPAPAPAPVVQCPIKDSDAMLAYCMEKYRALGPTKGGMIQTILIEMGVSNINTIPHDRYNEFYAKVEAL